MLTNPKFVISAACVINESPITTFTAVIDSQTCDINFAERPTDKAACKAHRDAVHQDRNEFQDYAYFLQDQIEAVMNSDEPAEAKE